MKVRLSDVIDGIDTVSMSIDCILDMETGEIFAIDGSDVLGAEDAAESAEILELLDEHGFTRLPDIYEINDYGTMEDFIETQPDSIRRVLYPAIRGSGAFRRFKDAVYRLGIEKSWYEFRDAAHRDIAENWCIGNRIDYENDVGEKVSENQSGADNSGEDE